MLPNEISVGREKINFEAKVLRIWRCDGKPDSWQSMGNLHTVFNLYLLLDEQTQNRRCLILPQSASNDAKVTPISNHFIHPQTVLRKSSPLTVAFWVQDYVEQLINSKVHYSDIVKFEPKLFCLRLKFANEEILDKFVAAYQGMQKDMARLHADTEVIWKANVDDIDAAKPQSSTTQKATPTAPSSVPIPTTSAAESKSVSQDNNANATAKPLFGGNPATSAAPSLFTGSLSSQQPTAAPSSKPQVAEAKGTFMTANAGSTPATGGGLLAGLGASSSASASSNTGGGSSLFGGFGGSTGSGAAGSTAADSKTGKSLFGGAPSSFGLSFAPPTSSISSETSSASKPLFGGVPSTSGASAVGDQSLFGGGATNTTDLAKSFFGPLGGRAAGDATTSQSTPAPLQKEEQAKPIATDSAKTEVKGKLVTLAPTPKQAGLFGNGGSQQTTAEIKPKDGEESASSTKETAPSPSASAPPAQRSGSESSVVSPPSLLGASRSISESILRRDSESMETNKPFFPITPAEPIFKNFPASPQLKPRSPSTPQIVSTSSPLVPPMSIGSSSAEEKENGNKSSAASKPVSSFFASSTDRPAEPLAFTPASSSGFTLSALANALSPSAEKEERPPVFSPTTTESVDVGDKGESSDFERKLQSFYANNNPQKIGEVPKLVEKYKDKQNEVWEKLKAKYPNAKEFVAADRPSSPVAATPVMPSRTLNSLENMSFEQQLRRFYEKYNPSKTDEVPKLVEKYKDKQAEVWTRLKTKYPAASPEDIPAVQQTFSIPAAAAGTPTPVANPFSGFASALGTPLTQTGTTSFINNNNNNNNQSTPGFTPSSVNAFAASKLNVTPTSTPSVSFGGPAGGGGSTSSSWAIPATQSIQFGAPKILQPGNLSARLNTPGTAQQQPASFGNFSASSFGQIPSSGGFSSFASQASGTSAFANLASQSNGNNAFNQ